MEESMKIDKTKMAPKSYLPLLLSFIFIDEVTGNFIFNIFAKQNGFYELILYSSFLIFSIIASPIQAGYSDFYCRKKSLVVSLSFSLASVFFILLSLQNLYSPFLFLSLAILAKAGLGNNVPLSWAGIADTQTKNFRFSFGLSTSAMAFGYLILIVIQKLFSLNASFFIIILSLSIILYFCIKYFTDIRDKKSPEEIQSQLKKIEGKILILEEMKLIINNFLKYRHIRKALVTYFLWELSFYAVLITDVDLKIKEFNHLSLGMMVGYLIGVLLLRIFQKKTDDQMIRTGYIISLLSLTFIFILSPVYNMQFILIPCFSCFSLAAAFLAPSLFAILSREKGPHEQGKIYGLIDSVDTIAFLLASISVMIYKEFNLNLVFFALFIFVVFALSWFPYAQFKKTRPNIKYQI